MHAGQLSTAPAKRTLAPCGVNDGHGRHALGGAGGLPSWVDELPTRDQLVVMDAELRTLLAKLCWRCTQVGRHMQCKSAQPPINSLTAPTCVAPAHTLIACKPHP